MCLFKSYETREPVRGVLDPPPRRGNYTSHPPAGVMRLPREWRRSESYSDDGRVVEYRYVHFLLPWKYDETCIDNEIGGLSPVQLSTMMSLGGVRQERVVYLGGGLVMLK